MVTALPLGSHSRCSLSVTELSITCGYHRLFSHGAYQAHPVLKAVFLLFGAMALQNSALIGAPAIVCIIGSSTIPSGILTARGAGSGFRTLVGCSAIIRAATPI